MLSTTEVLSIGTVERIHIAGTLPTYVVRLTDDSESARGTLSSVLLDQAVEDHTMAARLGAENAYADLMQASAHKWARLAARARENGWVALTWTQAARLAPTENEPAPWAPLSSALREAAMHGTGTLIVG